jgi:phospholipid-transporting ATPase
MFCSSCQSQVVELVKAELKAVTLAIGDGANDCPMIQSAHIGVGLTGQEGMQAARCADYSFAQFRFLSRLLLLHGRWGYRRVTGFVYYYFYKNMCMALSEFCFAFYCAASGQIWFPAYLSLMFNAFFTSWAIMVNGIMDRDVSADASMTYPELYALGRDEVEFNWSVFCGWVASAFWHAAVCFFVPMLAFAHDAVTADGRTLGLWPASTTSYFCVPFIFCFEFLF